MTFYEFLEKKLNFPLCRTSNVFKAVFKAIGNQFDELKSDIFVLLKEYFASSSENVYNYADERGIKKFLYESDDEYKDRIINAYAWYSQVETMSGIIYVLDRITTAKYQIIEYSNKNNYWVLGTSKLGTSKLGGEKLGIAVNFTETITESDRLYVYDVLREYIASHVPLYVNIVDYRHFKLGTSKLSVDSYLV